MIAILKKYNCRMIYNEREEWFHAGDIGKILELTNIRKVLPNIEKEFKMKFKEPDVTESYNRNFTERLNNRGELFLKPHAVYNVAFRSNKPEAKEFTRWVTEVIESVRTNRYYIATEKDEKWLGARKDSKIARKSETDVIKEFTEYAKNQGSHKFNMYYKHFTNLPYKKLNIPKELKRDDMSQDVLMRVQTLEVLISMKLKTLMAKNEEYKEIYQIIKELINNI